MSIKPKQHKSSVVFAKEIREMARTTGGTHLECILEMIEAKIIEAPVAYKLVRQNPSLKKILEEEATGLKLINE